MGPYAARQQDEDHADAPNRPRDEDHAADRCSDGRTAHRLDRTSLVAPRTDCQRHGCRCAGIHLIWESPTTPRCAETYRIGCTQELSQRRCHETQLGPNHEHRSDLRPLSPTDGHPRHLRQMVGWGERHRQQYAQHRSHCPHERYAQKRRNWGDDRSA